ncbi:hypothetical protein U9M48_033221 [Paspalum notatum var. saurae]|uniref:Uncharacterized protein n=1 Tax=Paspalum notatum var. saurae TaxID=547442 RepID=A0AAQ3U6E0_PASNO
MSRSAASSWSPGSATCASTPPRPLLPSAAATDQNKRKVYAATWSRDAPTARPCIHGPLVRPAPSIDPVPPISS